jgi:16S rRNA (guanine527-N7)-methyltransferase
VKRLREVAAEHGLDPSPFQALLGALAAEPDPPTTVSDPVDEHVADSLSVLPFLVPPPARIADLGSGAGFPGLALAAALPGSRVTLVESQRRHAAVAERLARGAGLENVTIAVARVEELGRPCDFDLVTARALAALPVLVEYAAPLLRLGGRLVAWKGARDSAEESSGQAAASLVGLEPEAVVQVRPFPGAHSRHLHFFAKTGETPDGFPRRSGIARKRPLA